MAKCFLILLLISNTAFSQRKNITPALMFDLPIEKNIVFNGISVNAGAWFGNNSLVPIGVFVGYRVYQPNFKGHIWNVFCLTLAWRVQVKDFLILPNFSYVNNDYQDLGMKVGYALDKEKTYFAHLSYCSQLGLSLGTTISIK
jgi:hypothetical protein